MTGERLGHETGAALKVARLVEPAVENLGYRIVRIRMIGAAGRTLQIMIERPDGTLTIDDCERVSRTLSPLLDVEDPISGTYDLEVSSPGIDRPLVRRDDFARWAGHVATIEMKTPRDGRRRFRGVLHGIEGDDVRVDLEPAARGGDGTEARLPFGDIAEAKLVMTDALIEAARARLTAAGLADGSDWHADDGDELKTGDDDARYDR
ncbi:MAG TPA: ribosome maturation factor RimP [Aestuariivirgaceae bacterium]|nr:ribosome maturation factor RimP [Aestuariivirgaceae bacterium]